MRPPARNKRLRNSLLVVSSFLPVEIPRDRSDQPIRFTTYRALYKSLQQSALRNLHSTVSSQSPLPFPLSLFLVVASPRCFFRSISLSPLLVFYFFLFLTFSSSSSSPHSLNKRISTSRRVKKRFVHI